MGDGWYGAGAPGSNRYLSCRNTRVRFQLSASRPLLAFFFCLFRGCGRPLFLWTGSRSPVGGLVDGIRVGGGPPVRLQRAISISAPCGWDQSGNVRPTYIISLNFSPLYMRNIYSTRGSAMGRPWVFTCADPWITHGPPVGPMGLPLVYTIPGMVDP